MDLPSLPDLIRTGKVTEAIAIVKANPSPIAASAAFAELSKQTYRELKDVSSMVALGNAGTQFAIAKAASPEHLAAAEQLKKSAKALAFNTAANCWPGWDDPGIEIKPEHLHAGLRLAELCRDLTVELNLGHIERGTSHWLIGALDLALARYAEALAEFERAKQQYQAAGRFDCTLMAEGYAALVQKAQARQAGAHELNRILQKLESQNSKEAKFFTNQIITADRVLLGPA